MAVVIAGAAELKDVRWRVAVWSKRQQKSVDSFEMERLKEEDSVIMRSK